MVFFLGLFKLAEWWRYELFLVKLESNIEDIFNLGVKFSGDFFLGIFKWFNDEWELSKKCGYVPEWGDLYIFHIILSWSYVKIFLLTKNTNWKRNYDNDVKRTSCFESIQNWRMRGNFPLLVVSNIKSTRLIFQLIRFIRGIIWFERVIHTCELIRGKDESISILRENKWAVGQKFVDFYAIFNLSFSKMIEWDFRNVVLGRNELNVWFFSSYCLNSSI